MCLQRHRQRRADGPVEQQPIRRDPGDTGTVGAAAVSERDAFATAKRADSFHANLFRRAVDSMTGGAGTATFTVTPHAVGKAVIGRIDLRGMSAVVPVNVSAKVGASKIYVTNLENNTVTMYNIDGTPSTPAITAGLNRLLP